MRLIFGIFFSTLAVILNCTELSSQRIQEKLVSGHILPHNELPDPFYYDSNGRIRVHGLPNAEPIIRNNFLIGFWNGEDFFGIIQENHLFVINLRDHRAIQQTHAQVFTLLHGHPPP